MNDFDVPIGGGALKFSAGLSVKARFRVPTDPVQIKHGKITVFFLATLFSRWVEFELDINAAVPPGKLWWVCLAKDPISGTCVLGFWIVMPRVPRIRVRIPTQAWGLAIPVASADLTAETKDIHARDKDGDDWLVVKAAVEVLSVTGYGNDPAFARELAHLVARAVSETIRNTLGGILGKVLRYVADFLATIVDFVLNNLSFITSWENYAVNELKNVVVGELQKLWDPTLDVRAGKLSRRHPIAAAEVTPSCNQAPITIDIDELIVSVNAGCQDPELLGDARFS